MSDEIEQFITSFEQAIQAREAGQYRVKLAKRARRLASNLSQTLGSAESDPVLLDLARRSEGIERKLGELATAKDDSLDGFITKGNAMLALEDILPAPALARVKALLEQTQGASASGGTRSRRVRLPFDLGAECLACGKTLVGGTRGTPRWGHIRTFITRHDQAAHDGFTAEERLDLRAAATTLEDGADEVHVKTYRIHRMVNG